MQVADLRSESCCKYTFKYGPSIAVLKNEENDLRNRTRRIGVIKNKGERVSTGEDG